jgi:phosphatidylethanolamine-binding protein (PEBP) family uncharacterized protein
MKRKTRHCKQICSCSPDVGDCPRCHRIKKRYKKTRKQRGGFAPLNISYNGKKVQGNQFTVEETAEKPMVEIPEGYTLIMYDPDAVNPSWIHWISTSSHDILPYKGPSPPKGSGIHHYKFILVPGTVKTNLATNQNRGGKSVSEYDPMAVKRAEFIVVAEK